MREWPLISIGIMAAALCCLLTPIALALVGIAGLWTIAGDLFLPLLIGVAVLAALALWLRAQARRRPNATHRSDRKA
jgi:nitrate/nitrite transporter NarK